MIQKDLTFRYGNLVGGVNDIKQHSWFSDINWMAVYEKKVNLRHQTLGVLVDVMILAAVKSKFSESRPNVFPYCGWKPYTVWETAEQEWVRNIHNCFGRPIAVSIAIVLLHSIDITV